jgi:hypothetical protein
MEGRAATAPAKYASLIFLLNTPLDVARMAASLFVRLN